MRNVSILHWITMGLLLIPWACLSGCQGGDSDEQLGTIIYEVPKVPGSEKPFLIPELDPKARSDSADGMPPGRMQAPGGAPDVEP